jgi:2-oxoglutarate dehydrogenase E2 component (dihydrolipoamide succinyltransferase)
MKFEVKVPSVGESINEVTIGQWMKKDGEYIEMDDILCEIESEKATLEVRSEADGVLKILTAEGDTVNIGHKIAEIDTDAIAPAQSSKSAAEKSEDSKEKIAITDKPPTEPELTQQPKEKQVSEREIKISPVAAKLLEGFGIDKSEIKGSGAGGRITKTDVETAIQSQSETEEPKPKSTSPEEKIVESDQQKTVQVQPPSFTKSNERSEKRVKMSTLRKTIARRLVAAKNETAMLTTFNELNMSAILEVRKRYKELFQEKYQIKLGFMSFFIKAACIALKEFPEVNARLEEDEVIYYDYCDISIAVSTPKGLVVPVIFNADRLSLAQLEVTVDQIAKKARDNKLTIEEMTGGTFSITNGGVFGSLLSTPIINAPQTAIFGMHKIEDRPIAVNGEVVIRPMMYIALSYDHRIIDGKESVSFLIRMKELLEDPARMLLDV